MTQISGPLNRLKMLEVPDLGNEDGVMPRNSREETHDAQT